MAQRATSLGPKPSLFFVFLLLFFCFPFFAFHRTKPVFHVKNGIFVYVSVYPFVFSPCLALRFSFFLPVSCPLFFLPSRFSCQFLGFAFCFCFVLFSRCFCFWFFCLLFCVVWNRNIIYFLVLHLVCLLLLLFLGFALIFCYFSIFGYLSENIFQKIWKFKKKQRIIKTKTDILTRAISTIVFTNSVIYIYVFL